jgi:hypothetical protein
MVVSNGSQRLTKEEVHIAFEGNIESSRLVGEWHKQKENIIQAECELGLLRGLLE